MGAKHVCFACREAVNVSYGATGPVRCTDCGADLVVLPHRFRPPKKREAEKWAAAQHLVAQGFWYQHLNPADFPDWTSGGMETTCASRKICGWPKSLSRRTERTNARTCKCSVFSKTVVAVAELLVAAPSERSTSLPTLRRRSNGPCTRASLLAYLV